LKYIRSFMAWRQAKEKGLTGDGSRERQEKASQVMDDLKKLPTIS
jgi:hypothetical protein